MDSRREWKLLEIIGETRNFFSSIGIEDARLQAELLLGDILNIERLDLYLQFERSLTIVEVDLYREHVRKRASGMPIQYVLGRASFRHLDLIVTPEVLIPRPETELLVDIAIGHVSKCDVRRPRYLDLCCGSGALALSIAHESKKAFVVGSDFSPSALKIARNNARRNFLSDKVCWVCSDLFESLNFSESEFDVIVCNPPYIPKNQLNNLQTEIKNFEPRLALDGGEDGLDYYRRIVKDSVDYLGINGSLILEVGDGQADEVARLIENNGYLECVNVVSDLNNRPRIVTGAKKSQEKY